MSSVKTVRCRFTCQTVTEQAPSYDGKRLFTVELAACYADDVETSKFFEATPSGKLEFGTINESAVAMFKPGKDYYLDLVPVPET